MWISILIVEKKKSILHWLLFRPAIKVEYKIKSNIRFGPPCSIRMFMLVRGLAPRSCKIWRKGYVLTPPLCGLYRQGFDPPVYHFLLGTITQQGRCWDHCPTSLKYKYCLDHWCVQCHYYYLFILSLLVFYIN